jgi:TonB-linked SusC/RagA family outer membrane protein
MKGATHNNQNQMYKVLQQKLWQPPCAITKLLLIMKLTTFILITVILQVSATTFAQKITLSEKNSSLVKVFDKISDQSGYDFLVSSEMLRSAKPVNIEASNLELKEVLKKIFEEQPLDYNVQEKMVVISKKTPTFLERLGDRWAAIDISGTVLDEKGIPLPGATVKVKGKNRITTTNNDGEFLLKDVDEEAILQISYVGYVDLEIKATKNLGSIRMTMSNLSLQEVMIGKGYYEEKQRFSVSNATRITARDIEKQPVRNVLLALQDRVPGLEITAANGMNGSGVNVRIQGTNSLVNGSDPLIIVDGVSYPSKSLITNVVGQSIVGNSNNGIGIGPGAGGSGNPLNYINPSDIESIDVLRDADATSIYGARAANGAIVITTKKGKPGKTEFVLNVQQGLAKVSKFLDLLNTQQYLMMRKEAFVNDNASFGGTDYDLNGHWDTTRYTNWQKELIGGTAAYNDINLSVSGGNLNTNFKLAGTYNRRTTVFPGDGANKSGNLSYSMNSTSENKKFSLQFSGNYTADLNALPSADLTAFAVKLAPNLPELRNPDGSLNWAPTSSGISSFSNPLKWIDAPYESKTTSFVSSLSLSYKVINGLQVKTNFGFVNQQSNEYKGRPLTNLAPEQRIVPDPSSLRIGQYSDNNIKSWKVEPQINYQTTVGNGKLDILIGGTAEQRNSEGLYQVGTNYVNDAMLRDIKSAAIVEVFGSDLVVYKNVGAFGRVNYNLLDKYIINLTARRDGSSRFGPPNRFHNFGAIGMGWIFSEEGVIKDKLEFLSFGKIRGSYGTTGNDQIGDYAYLPTLVAFPVSMPYQNSVGYIIGGGANEYLQWEETEKLQIGIDLGFLKDRILVSGNYIRNRSSNQLLQYELPIMTGWTSVDVNFPATLQNTAGEFTLNTVNIQNSRFRWTTSANFTIPKNKLIKFDDIERSPYAKN